MNEHRDGGKYLIEMAIPVAESEGFNTYNAGSIVRDGELWSDVEHELAGYYDTQREFRAAWNGLLDWAKAVTAAKPVRLRIASADNTQIKTVEEYFGSVVVSGGVVRRQ